MGDRVLSPKLPKREKVFGKLKYNWQIERKHQTKNHENNYEWPVEKSHEQFQCKNGERDPAAMGLH